MNSGIGVMLAAALAVLVAVAGPAAAEGSIDLELNKVAAKGDVCRLTFVFKNDTEASFSALELYFMFFDLEGGIISDLAVDFGQLRSQKTVVRFVDVPELSCPAIAKVLLNDVVACEPAGTGGVDCLDLIQPSARGDVDFYK